VSDADVEVMKQGFEALSKDGIEGLIPFIDPEFETTTPAGLAAEPDTYRGHNGVRRYWRSFEEIMDDVRFEPQRMTPLGDAVLVDLVVRARGKATGIEVEQHIAQIWKLRDGKAVSAETYASESEAVAAHGGG
jgi:ketosteroid isomerase-like protein